VLGERENDAALLEEAVKAYEGALGAFAALQANYQVTEVSEELV
jgi:hypothetical protein